MPQTGASVIWITGSGGLIGTYLVATAAKTTVLQTGTPAALESRGPAARSGSGLRVVGLTRPILDLTDVAAVCERFRRDRPELIIHCAALTRAVLCEQDPALARKINVEVTRLLVDLAADVFFLFISTDLVFDGKTGWYDEEAPVNPLTVYAQTKAEAEQIVFQNPSHTVIRTSLNGGTSPAGNRGFNEELRRAWESGKATRLFVDEFRCPIPAVETARAIWDLVNKRATGLFHVAGKERLSRWQIGELVAARWPQLHPKLERGSIHDYAGPPRSADTSLSCAKAEGVLGRPLPRLNEWLKAHPEERF